MATEPSAPETEQPGPSTGGSPSSDAPGSQPSDAPRAEPRFFGWIRSLGLVRREGWLGGVCAALADRLRLDPVLVRGIVVVLAVLGAPVVVLYAAAWLLLPDEHGRIHALRLARGQVDRAIIGIAVLALLSLLPLAQGVWWAGAAYWGAPDLGGSVGRVIWTGIVIAAVVVLVVWFARRGSPDVVTVPATTDDKPDTVPRPAEFAATPDGALAEGTTTATAGDAAPAPAPAPAPASAAPERPPAGATDAELAAWREQQQAWREQRAAWVAQQRAEDRERRAAASASWAREREARRAAFRAREPFVGGAYIGAALGLGIVAGGIAAIAALVIQPDRLLGPTVGFGAAAVVFGLALAIAGVARRRAGALALFAIVAVVVAVATAPLAAGRQLLLPGYASIDTTRSGDYLGSGGIVEMAAYIPPTHPSARTIDLQQRGGIVIVRAAEDESLRVVVDMPNRVIRTGHLGANRDNVLDGRIAPTSVHDGIAHYDVHFGAPGAPDLTVRLALTGDAGVRLLTDAALTTTSPSASSPTPSATPSATPSVTEGAQP